VALVARIVTWRHDPHFTYAANLYPTHLRLDSLLAGVLLSYYHAFHGPEVLAFVNRFQGWLAPVSLAAIMPTLFIDQDEPFMYTLGYSLLWWGFALLLLMVLYPIRAPKPPNAVGRTLAALGRVSYAFYLWHMPVLAVADHMSAAAASYGIQPSVGTIFATSGLAFLVTLLMALATTWAVEAPFLRLRDRWLPSRAAAEPLPRCDPPAGALGSLIVFSTFGPFRASYSLGRLAGGVSPSTG
jgi:peptidoglycan/LPS O-acetylase OafA/YrhL